MFPRFIHSRLVALITAGVLVVIYSSFRSPAYELIAQMAAYLSLMVPLFTITRFVQTREREHLFISPALIMTWLFFEEPYLHSEKVFHYYRIIPEQYIPEMAIFSGLGILFSCLGYYSTFRKASLRPLSTKEFKFSLTSLNNVIILLILLRISFLFLPIIPSLLGRLTQFIDFIPTVTLALFVLYWVRGGRSLLLLIFVSTYLLSEYLYAVAQTLFTSIILIFIGGIFVYMLEKRKIPYIFLIIFSLVNVPIYLTRHQFRIKIVDRWYNPEANHSRLSVINEGADNLQYLWTHWSYSNLLGAPEVNTTSSQTDYRKIHSSRMEHISYLGQCVYKHQIEGWPYRLGGTFWWLPLSPIPRIIFPIKPKSEMGTKVAAEYGLKGQNSRGSMNFPMLVEYFINFGFFGIPVFSFFQGLFMRYSVRKTAFGEGDINLIILLNLLYYLVKVGSNVILVMGAIIQILFFWTFILYFIRKKIIKMTFNSR